LNRIQQVCHIEDNQSIIFASESDDEPEESFLYEDDL
jgi:hypothetical protein